MKKVLVFITVSLMVLVLVACGKKDDIGAVIPENDNISVGEYIPSDENGTDEVQTLSFPESANVVLKDYVGEKVDGLTFLTFMKRVKALEEMEILPLEFSFEYKDGLTEETIVKDEFYKVEIFDALPEGDVDGFFDLAVISKIETESGSGE